MHLHSVFYVQLAFTLRNIRTNGNLNPRGFVGFNLSERKKFYSKVFRLARFNKNYFIQKLLFEEMYTNVFKTRNLLGFSLDY